ncbi:MAG: hypothetical protein U5N53_28240 [Mycobacterium sp.]|nr:hypothetical protein [Mycobacterium sp.]
MSATPCTVDTRDLLGRPDNGVWTFSSPETRPAPGGAIVTARPRTLQPRDGVLTVDLLPGPVRVQYRGETFDIVVPESDTPVDLRDLMGGLA